MKKIAIFLSILCIIANFTDIARANPTRKEMKKYLENYTLVVFKNNEFKFYNERGIKPLLIHLQNNDFKDAYVADRIIGKAAALLYVKGGAKKIYTPVISKDGAEILKKYKISFHADKKIEYIINRTKTDICPMEKKVKDISDPKKAYEVLNSF